MTPEGHFSAAVSEHVAGLEGPLRNGRERHRLLAPVLAIDRLIDVLEVRNLAGLTALHRSVDEDLAVLSSMIRLPYAVTDASSTVGLHAALLDLQEPALHALARSRYGEVPTDDPVDAGWSTDPVTSRRPGR